MKQKILQWILNIFGIAYISIEKYVDYPDFNKVAQAFNYSVNGDKLRNLGFKPEISFDEGLKSLCS